MSTGDGGGGYDVGSSFGYDGDGEDREQLSGCKLTLYKVVKKHG